MYPPPDSTVKVTEDDYGGGVANFPNEDLQTLAYRVPQEANARFEILRSKINACVETVAASYEGEMLTAEELDDAIRTAIGNQAYGLMQEEALPAVPEGVYRIRVSYVLPDGRVTTPGWPIDLQFLEPASGGLGNN